jgi:transposase
LDEIRRALQHFGLPADSRVVSCYEAGRDGFWIHRLLVAHAVANVVVDASSIEVKRRARRAKTDRLDATKLLAQLIRYHGGERQVWSVVRVPSVADEDHRQVHRALEAAKQDQARLVNRLKGILVTHGVRMSIRRDFPKRLAAVRSWNDEPLPAGVCARLLATWESWQFVARQIVAAEAARATQLQEASTEGALDQVRRLRRLAGIDRSAWTLSTEAFGWRQFRNGREIGALLGLTPTPYDSGESHRDQGISRAGHRRLRALSIQLAWSWLRHQPTSALSRWYRRRFADGGARMRRIGIVALARKLMIALWRYAETGVVPDGAQLKAAAK